MCTMNSFHAVFCVIIVLRRQWLYIKVLIVEVEWSGKLSSASVKIASMDLTDMKQ